MSGCGPRTFEQIKAHDLMKAVEPLLVWKSQPWKDDCAIANSTLAALIALAARAPASEKRKFIRRCRLGENA